MIAFHAHVFLSLFLVFSSVRKEKKVVKFASRKRYVQYVCMYVYTYVRTYVLYNYRIALNFQGTKISQIPKRVLFCGLYFRG